MKSIFLGLERFSPKWKLLEFYCSRGYLGNIITYSLSIYYSSQFQPFWSSLSNFMSHEATIDIYLCIIIGIYVTDIQMFRITELRSNLYTFTIPMNGISRRDQALFFLSCFLKKSVTLPKRLWKMSSFP